MIKLCFYMQNGNRKTLDTFQDEGDAKRALADMADSDFFLVSDDLEDMDAPSKSCTIAAAWDVLETLNSLQRGTPFSVVSNRMVHTCHTTLTQPAYLQHMERTVSDAPQALYGMAPALAAAQTLEKPCRA